MLEGRTQLYYSVGDVDSRNVIDENDLGVAASVNFSKYISIEHHPSSRERGFNI